MPKELISAFLTVMIFSSVIQSLSAYSDGSKVIPEAIHKSLMKYLGEYMAVGGMPDAVNAFLSSSDYGVVHSVQERIIKDYYDDIARYASPADRIKARSCFSSIPRQLSEENHKFQYSVVEKKGSARKYQSSLDWLLDAGMICFSYNLSAPAFPLKAYINEDQFRVYLCDIGLLNCMYGYQMKAAIIMDKLEGAAKGGIYESLIADILSKRDIALYYYKRQDSTLEIEFFLERNFRPVPLEVKAKKGASKSLNELLKNPAIETGYKLTAQNTGVSGKKITLPLYMAMLI